MPKLTLTLSNEHLRSLQRWAAAQGLPVADLAAHVLSDLAQVAAAWPDAAAPHAPLPAQPADLAAWLQSHPGVPVAARMAAASLREYLAARLGPEKAMSAEDLAVWNAAWDEVEAELKQLDPAPKGGPDAAGTGPDAPREGTPPS